MEIQRSTKSLEFDIDHTLFGVRLYRIQKKIDFYQKKIEDLSVSYLQKKGKETDWTHPLLIEYTSLSYKRQCYLDERLRLSRELQRGDYREAERPDAPAKYR